MIAKDTKSEDEPLTFDKAWNHSNLESWKIWHEAIQKEFINMKKQKVWRKTFKSLMPPKYRCVKNKWVFKTNPNGMYWAYFVTCGYIQVPEVAFSKNYFPVANDIFPMVTSFGFSAKIVYIKIALYMVTLKRKSIHEAIQAWLHYTTCIRGTQVCFHSLAWFLSGLLMCIHGDYEDKNIIPIWPLLKNLEEKFS